MPDDPEFAALDGSLTAFLRQLGAGDAASAEALWQQFFPRLVRLARGTLARHAQGTADAEDAAQSALISLWRRAGRGDLRSLDGEGLWALLATITHRKSLRRVRAAMTQKRGGGRVKSATDLGDGETPVDEILAVLPAHDVDLICEELLLALPDDVRPFAVLRIVGHTHAEIAGQLGCSVRKVERKLQLVRRMWAELDNAA
jgi:DNA-directed RNA polymerase specialized sigma24 family protein